MGLTVCVCARLKRSLRNSETNQAATPSSSSSFCRARKRIINDYTRGWWWGTGWLSSWIVGGDHARGDYAMCACSSNQHNGKRTLGRVEWSDFPSTTRTVLCKQSETHVHVVVLWLRFAQTLCEYEFGLHVCHVCRSDVNSAQIERAPC